MKFKRISIMICAMAVTMVMGCGQNDVSDMTADSKLTNVQTNVQTILDQGTSASEAGAEQEEAEEMPLQTEPETIADTQEETEGTDVDLTVLSSTMVYSEVYNMMYYPENYVGKSVKMKGTYAVFHDETTGKYYHGCIIQDATACCSQGIEFELTDEYSFPDDYPAQGQEICVTGIFDTYMEGSDQFCTLRNASLL